jgi:hypothetical protein
MPLPSFKVVSISPDTGREFAFGTESEVGLHLKTSGLYPFEQDL